MAGHGKVWRGLAAGSVALSAALSAASLAATVAAVHLAVDAWRCAQAPAARCEHGIGLAVYGYGNALLLTVGTAASVAGLGAWPRAARLALAANATGWILFGAYIPFLWWLFR